MEFQETAESPRVPCWTPDFSLWDPAVCLVQSRCSINTGYTG